MANQPYEIVSGSLLLYVAAVGTSFPAIEDAPASPWVKIGTLGDQEMDESGVSIQHDQTIEKYRGLGSNGPIKAKRTAEELMVTFTSWDLTLENYTRALNFGSVTDTAAGGGAAGHRAIDIYRGRDVAERAILVRGEDRSPYGDSWAFQWEIPRAYQDGSPELVWVKGAPVGLEFVWVALEDLNAAAVANRFGAIRVQDAAVA